jgi:hypothetical protein
MLKNLEHHEHAEHLAHQAESHGGGAHDKSGHEAGEGGRMAALMVAVLAAGLAITEQGAKHAEIRVSENTILAADAWAQYQAKSTRGTFSEDLSGMISVLGPADEAVTKSRAKFAAKLKDDQDRFDNDPNDGKNAIAQRARGFEEVRDHSLEETHAYHNGAAAMELGIVLTTASAIIHSRLLMVMAFGLGLIGSVLAVLGFLAPELGAF